MESPITITFAPASFGRIVKPFGQYVATQEATFGRPLTGVYLAGELPLVDARKLTKRYSRSVSKIGRASASLSVDLHSISLSSHA